LPIIAYFICDFPQNNLKFLHFVLKITGNETLWRLFCCSACEFLESGCANQFFCFGHLRARCEFGSKLVRLAAESEVGRPPTARRCALPHIPATLFHDKIFFLLSLSLSLSCKLIRSRRAQQVERKKCCCRFHNRYFMSQTHSLPPQPRRDTSKKKNASSLPPTAGPIFTCLKQRMETRKQEINHLIFGCARSQQKNIFIEKHSNREGNFLVAKVFCLFFPLGLLNLYL
jgi:hypothetical protein